MNPQPTYRKLLWPAAAVLLTLAVMWPNVHNGFVNWDDPAYVQENPLIEGLSGEKIAGIFTTPQVQGNYHPLTLLSYAVDRAVFGGSATGYHITNLILHCLNVALVYFVFLLLTGRPSWSGIIALLFGIHPMHLESVAWISARKDVLYGFFFLCALLAYLRYREAERRKFLWYGLCVTAFLLSLLSKSMAVTLPLALLLVDYLQKRPDWRMALLEKLPLLAMSVLFGLFAVSAQKEGQAVADMQPLEGVFVAGYGTITYLVRAVFPANLAAYHPYPYDSFAEMPWYMYGSAVLLLSLLISLYRRRKSRKLVFGAGFFLISILPVLQLLPVGTAIVAERYTYIAYLGLFFLVVWGWSYLNEKYPRYRAALLAGGIVWTVLLGIVTSSRAKVWQNSETLWTDVIAKHPDHFLGYMNRSKHYRLQGDVQKALADLDAAVRAEPNLAAGYNNRGRMHMEARRWEAALHDFDRAVARDPEAFEPRLNLGVACMNLGRPVEALEHLNAAAQLNPDDPRVWYNRGYVQGMRGNFSAAITDFDKAIALDPSQPVFYKDRAMARDLAGDLHGAVSDYSQAISMDGDFAAAYMGRSHSYHRLGDLEQARADALKARELGMEVPKEYARELGLGA